MHPAHIQGIGEGNGRLQGSQLIDLDEAQGFAKAVETQEAAVSLSLKGLREGGRMTVTPV